MQQCLRSSLKDTPYEILQLLHGLMYLMVFSLPVDCGLQVTMKDDLKVAGWTACLPCFFFHYSCRFLSVCRAQSIYLFLPGSHLYAGWAGLLTCSVQTPPWGSELFSSTDCGSDNWVRSKARLLRR
jgi:hypothetical protein